MTRRARTTILAGLVLAVAFAVAPAAQAAVGDLDTGFGVGGIFTGPQQTTFPPYAEQVVDVDPQGRPLVAWTFDDGTAFDDNALKLAVARLTPGGAVDDTFGGVRVIDFTDAPGSNVRAAGVAAGPGGTVVAAGQVDPETTSPSIAVVRLTSAGEYDATFSSDGRLVTKLRAGYDPQLQDIAVDGSGRVLAAGTELTGCSPLPCEKSGFVARFTSGGALDTASWAGDGSAEPVGAASSELFAVAPTAEGGAVAAGTKDADALAVRLTAEGAPDSSFSGDGAVTTLLGGNGYPDLASAFGVAVDGSDRVLITGQLTLYGGGAALPVARFTSSGDHDPAWGSGTPASGVVHIPTPGGGGRGYDLRVQSDGKVIVSGQTARSAIDSDQAVLIARLTAGGLLDTAFAADQPTQGVRLTAEGVNDSRGSRLALTADGAIYQSGLRWDAGTDVKPIVLRYVGDAGPVGGGPGGGPAPGPGDGGPGPGDGDGGAGGSALRASLLAPATSRTLRPLELDARGSTGAASFLWDLNGDGRDDVQCAGGSPVLSTRLLSSATRTVRLTAVGVAGDRSTAQQTVSLAGRGVSSAIARAVAQPATCAADRGSQTASASVAALCTDEVTWGVVEAKGCLRRITRPEDVPAGERPIIDELIAQFRARPQLREYIQMFCKEVRQQDCTRRTTTIDRRDTVGPLLGTDLYVSTTRVRMNGLEIVPAAGASVVVFPQINRIVSKSATVRLGGVTVSSGGLNLDVEKPGPLTNSIFSGSGRLVLASFDARKSLPAIGGFPLDGQAELALATNGFDRWSELTIRLRLPAVFDIFGDDAPNGGVKLVADNARGLVIDGIHLKVPEATLGGLRFTNVGFDYAARGDAEAGCARDWWKATANVFLGVTDDDAGFRLSPPPSQNGVAFCDGGFKSAGGALQFGTAIPPPQIFPGVFLTEISFATQLDPTLLRGGGRISVADVSEVDGVLFTVFPSAAAPYTLTAADAGSQFSRLAGSRYTTTTIGVGGTVGLNVPKFGRIDFGNGYLVYSYPDYVAVGGGVQLPAPGMIVRGGLYGEFAVASKVFSVEGDIEACVAGGLGCIGARGFVTSTGIVVCGEIAGTLHPGAGYKWGDSWLTDLWLVDGCKMSPYWVTVRAQAAAGEARTFTVKPGQKSIGVRLRGGDGAPEVEVRAPDGETASTAGSDFVDGPHVKVLRQEEGGVTWIGVADARPGTYTVTPLDGSPAITAMAASEPLPPARIRASVSRAGARRTLRYDVAPRRAQRVTFFERSGTALRRLGAAAGRRGALRFTPGAGAGPAREIVAEVAIDGLAREQLVVARYRVPVGPPARPARVRAVHRGNSLRVAWTPARGAERYGVVARRRDGAQRVLRVPARRRSLVVKGMPRGQSGTVAVRGLGLLGEPGKARVARFRASGRGPRARLLAFRQLGRRRAAR